MVNAVVTVQILLDHSHSATPVIHNRERYSMVRWEEIPQFLDRHTLIEVSTGKIIFTAPTQSRLDDMAQSL